MRRAAALLSALALAACAPSTTPQAKATSTAQPAPTVAPTPTPGPIVDVAINYMEQSGSHYTVWLDVTNHGSAPASGKPLLTLYWHSVGIGRICGPAVSVAPGATSRVKFERMNGPAALSDHEDTALVSSC